MRVKPAALLLSTMLILSMSQAAEFSYPGLGPKLTVGADNKVVLSYMEARGDEHALLYRIVGDSGPGEPVMVSQGSDWFVNWADFPSVQPMSGGLWVAHWLVRREAGGYAYDIHAATSVDGGQTWDKAFLLHDDGTDSEHGFVTLFPAGKNSFAVVWLDGRNMAAAQNETGHSAGAMTLRGGRFDQDGKVLVGDLIDNKTCDCCQTDVAIAAAGPVAAYRDRSDDEIRDIYVSRFIDGEWQRGQPLHHDNWNIPGCPVNGPVIDAIGETVVVTWFTAALGSGLVQAKLSDNSGSDFGEPITLSAEGVVGYVASTLISADTAVSAWLCKADDRQNSICYRTIKKEGNVGPIQMLQTGGIPARMSVPQLATICEQVLFVWTEKIDDGYQIKGMRVPFNALDASELAAN